MQTDFQLIGLEKLHSHEFMSATLQSNGVDTFKALIDGDIDRKKALWNLCENDWEAKKVATVKHNGIKNGFPIDPIVVSIAYE